MTVAVQAEPLLSVRAASDWLKRHGVEGHSRHMVLVAIAKGMLIPAGISERQIFVRESELERFAAEQNKAARNK